VDGDFGFCGKGTTVGSHSPVFLFLRDPFGHLFIVFGFGESSERSREATFGDDDE